MDIQWPEADLAAMKNGQSFYQGAAICRRGHTESSYINPAKPSRAIAENCTRCGARVLTSCPTCQLRIRGKRYMPNVISATPAHRPSFCDGCGAAYPWATREERIYELENLLDQEGIDEADLVVIQDHLVRLRDSSLSEKDETQVWMGIKRRAGAGLKSPAVSRVVEGLVSATIRHQLGL